MVNMNDVATIVAEYLPDTYEVSVHNGTKNNGIKKQGILVSEGTLLSPIIYVDRLIEEGLDANEIAIKVIEQYKQAKEQEVPFDISELGDFEEMKRRICYRLVNLEANKDMLMKVPYEQIANDLALVYFLDLNRNATITITEELLKAWNIEKDELYKVAQDNMPVLYPPQLRSMADVMIDMLGNDFEMMKIEFGKTDLDEEEFREFLKNEVIGGGAPMYVLQGRESFGASVLLYEDMDKILRERFGDVYIIPSSVHEVLVVPVDEARNMGLTANDIKILVEQVNETTVAPDERLSNNVYVINKDGLLPTEEYGETIIDDDVR